MDEATLKTALAHVETMRRQQRDEDERSDFGKGKVAAYGYVIQLLEKWIGEERAPASGGFRERCRRFLNEARQKAMMRTGDPVQDLMEFIIAERGRAEFPAGTDVSPLVLYFGSPGDREEFLRIWQETYPGAIAKKVL